MTDRLTSVLAWLLRHAAWLLPPGRRLWAEAVQAEAAALPAGWPRLGWLAGGLWLVVREVKMMRKVVYWLGVSAVTAAAAWVVWLSWRTSPAADALAATDRVRVLVGVPALVVLPWVGRRRGWFGPVGRSITARVVRVAGCASVCGLGVTLVRMDRHIGPGPHGPPPFSLPREIAALAIIGAALAALAVVKARWPDTEASALWAAASMAGFVIFTLVPLQTLAIMYAAGILAATSRRSPATSVSLAAGTITGLAAGLATSLAMYEAAGNDSYAFPLLLGSAATVFLLAALAGVAAARRLSGIEDPQELRAARLHQGLLAGSAAGVVCGLLLTDFFALAGVVMMVIGPLAGLGGGAIGGALAADHPREARPDRIRDVGLFVFKS
jgi:hypothetical protein